MIPCTFAGCPFEFQTEAELKIHLKNFHRYFPCPNADCACSYTSADTLSKHITSVHRGVRYACACGQSWAYPNKFYTHRLTCRFGGQPVNRIDPAESSARASRSADRSHGSKMVSGRESFRFDPFARDDDESRYSGAYSTPTGRMSSRSSFSSSTPSGSRGSVDPFAQSTGRGFLSRDDSFESGAFSRASTSRASSSSVVVKEEKIDDRDKARDKDLVYNPFSSAGRTALMNKKGAFDPLKDMVKSLGKESAKDADKSKTPLFSPGDLTRALKSVGVNAVVETKSVGVNAVAQSKSVPTQTHDSFLSSSRRDVATQTGT